LKTGRLGGTMMMEKRRRHILFLIAVLIFLMFVAMRPASYAASKTTPAKSSAAVVEVNGVKFTQNQLDAEMTKRLAALKAQMPADRLQQVKPEIRKQILDDFVIRTLLSQEVKRLKIDATEQEFTEAMERLKSTLPPGATLN
jgi:flagellar basal body-associated protein FliL